MKKTTPRYIILKLLKKNNKNKNKIIKATKEISIRMMTCFSSETIGEKKKSDGTKSLKY